MGLLRDTTYHALPRYRETAKVIQDASILTTIRDGISYFGHAVGTIEYASTGIAPTARHVELFGQQTYHSSVYPQEPQVSPDHNPTVISSEEVEHVHALLVSAPLARVSARGPLAKWQGVLLL